MSGEALLERMQRQGPDHRVVLRDNNEALTLTVLQQRITAVGQLLQEAGVSRLGLHADNSLGWIVVDLACRARGIVCVPLPLFFTSTQLLHVLGSCGLDAIVTANADQFSTHFKFRHNSVAGELTLLSNGARMAVPLPEGTGKVTFTSGSTGTPKGVCLGWDQLERQARVLAEAVGLDAPRHLCVLPLSTLLENVAGVYAPLWAGGEVVVCPLADLGFQGSRLTSPLQFLQTLSRVQPQTLILIPQLLHLLVQAVKNGWQPPKLEFIAVGGSRVAPVLVQEARKLGLPVYEGYGLSECASVVSLNTPAHDLAGSAGHVLPHVQLSNTNGELVVSGNTMLGYVGELQSWYPKTIATGDIGHVDGNGFVHISGRSKNLLISSYGRNIAPEWVESELLATPLLADAVVYGDAQPYCVALVSPRDTATPDALIQTVINATNMRLPDYAQVQRWHRLPAMLAANPQLLTTNGRPRRAAIAAAFAGELAALYPATPALSRTAGAGA